MIASPLTVLLLTAGSAVEAAETPRELALLVGIGDYASGYGAGNPVPVSEQWPSLAGPRNDVEAMRSLLIERGFSDADILVLEDEEATRAGIQAAFRTHLGQARQGDVALFYYSGHGHQVTDDDGDERDGYDEALVPHDNGGRETGAHYLRDDDLDALKREVATDELVFIIDACHSGTATRGEAASRGHEIPAGPPAELRGEGEDEGGGFLGDAPRGYVMLSATRAGEPAVERRVGEGTEVMGAFTWLLVQELRRAGEHNTWGQVGARLRGRMSAERLSQVPQVEGDVQKRVFSGYWGSAPRRFPARYSAGGVQVAAGGLHGLGVGDMLGVYPAGGAELLAEATVTALSPTRAAATLDAVHSVTADVARAGVEVAILRSDLQLYAPRLDLTAAPRATREALLAFALARNIRREDVALSEEERWTQAPGDLVIQAVDGGERLRLARITDEVGNDWVIPIPTACGQPTAWDIAADHPALTELLRQAIELDRARSRLQGLSNAGAGRLEVSLGLEYDTSTEGELPVSGSYDLQARNHESERSIYVAILELRTDGGIQTLFPPEGAGRDRSLVPPGETLTVASIAADGVPGTLSWALIATADYTDFGPLEQRVRCHPDALRGAPDAWNDALTAAFSSSESPWGTDVRYLKLVE